MAGIRSITAGVVHPRAPRPKRPAKVVLRAPTGGPGFPPLDAVGSLDGPSEARSKHQGPARRHTQEGSCPGVAQLRHHYLYALAPASRTGVEPTEVGSRHGTQVVGHLGFSARRCAGHPRARQPRHRRSTAPCDPVVRTRTFSRPHLPCSGHGHGPRVVGRSILGGGVVHRGSDRPWRR